MGSHFFYSVSIIFYYNHISSSGLPLFSNSVSIIFYYNHIISDGLSLFSNSVSIIFYYNHISSDGLPPFFSAILLPPPKQNTDRKRRQVTMSDIFRLVRPD